MDLQSIVIDHGEKELLRRAQGPMRFIGVFGLVLAGIAATCAFVEAWFKPLHAGLMLMMAVIYGVQGAYTHAAGAAFRSAAETEVPRRVWNGIAQIGRLFWFMRLLIFIYFLVMIGFLVGAIVKNM